MTYDITLLNIVQQFVCLLFTWDPWLLVAMKRTHGARRSLASTDSSYKREREVLACLHLPRARKYR